MASCIPDSMEDKRKKRLRTVNNGAILVTYIQRRTPLCIHIPYIRSANAFHSVSYYRFTFVIAICTECHCLLPLKGWLKIAHMHDYRVTNLYIFLNTQSYMACGVLCSPVNGYFIHKTYTHTHANRSICKHSHIYAVNETNGEHTK